MRRSARLLALTVTSVVVLAVPPATASTDEPVTRQAPGSATYEGTFTGELTWRHRVEYGGPNHRTASADITVISTMPTVTMAGGLVTSGGTPGSVTVWGEGESRTVTDEGEHLSSCEGEKVVPSTNAGSFISPVAGRTTFYAFTSLSLVETCTATDDPRPSQVVVALKAVPVPVTIRAADVGKRRIDVPIDRTLTKEKCLYYERLSTECTYRLEGILTFRLRPVMEPFEPPTRPVWKPRAGTLSVKARCATDCRVTVAVDSIHGPGRATTDTTLRPREGRTLTVRPGARLRRSIDRSGRARLKVTYRNDQTTKTYTRVFSLSHP